MGTPRINGGCSDPYCLAVDGRKKNESGSGEGVRNQVGGGIKGVWKYNFGNSSVTLFSGSNFPPSSSLKPLMHIENIGEMRLTGLTDFPNAKENG